MKYLTAILACLTFCSCTTTTFYDRKTGKKIAQFPGDMQGSRYRDGDTSWDVESVIHSTIIRSWGSFSGTVATGATSVLMAGKGVPLLR